MTVLEGIQASMYPLPEGTVTAVYIRNGYSHGLEPTIEIESKLWVYHYGGTFSVCWRPCNSQALPFGPNVASRDAFCFEGFFGTEYDTHLEEVSD